MKLASLTNTYWQGACTLKLFRAFTSVNLLQLKKLSLHYSGRALDVALDDNEDILPLTRRINCESEMKKLAWIAYKHVGFSYASLKNHPNHLHISCKSS